MFTSWETIVWLKHSGSVLRLEVRRLGHPSWRRWGWAGRRIFGGREEREGHSRLWSGMSHVWAMSDVKNWQALMKLKSFCTTKETISKVKDSPQIGRK